MRMVAVSFWVICSGSLFGQSLRILADERGIRFGAAVAPAHFGEVAYAETLAREFNQVEPENAMKFVFETQTICTSASLRRLKSTRYSLAVTF